MIRRYREGSSRAVGGESARTRAQRAWRPARRRGDDSPRRARGGARREGRRRGARRRDRDARRARRGGGAPSANATRAEPPPPALTVQTEAEPDDSAAAEIDGWNAALKQALATPAYSSASPSTAPPHREPACRYATMSPIADLADVPFL